MTKKLRDKGFGLVGSLLIVTIIAALGVGGWLAWHAKHPTKKPSSVATTSSQKNASSSSSGSTTTAQADPYPGWKIYSSTTLGLSFRYPSTWTVQSGSEDQSGTEINSPVDDGYYFSIQLASGSEQDISQNFLGNAPGTTLATLSAANKTPLYLVAQTSGPNGQVTGIGLATTPGSASTSFGILDQDGAGSNNITMSANLIPAGSNPGLNNPYDLQTYQSQTSYQTVLDIFQSLSYK